MQIDRSPTKAKNLCKLAEVVGRMNSPCVGCKDCTGLCEMLVEVVTLPDAILSRGRTE